MGKNQALVALIVWMLISLALALSVIGLVLFFRSDGNSPYWEGDKGRSAWAKIGLGLYQKIVE